MEEIMANLVDETAIGPKNATRPVVQREVALVHPHQISVLVGSTALRVQERAPLIVAVVDVPVAIQHECVHRRRLCGAGEAQSLVASKAGKISHENA